MPKIPLVLACATLVAAPVAAAQQLVLRPPKPALAYPPDLADAPVVDVVVAIVVDEAGAVTDAQVAEKRPPDAPAVFDETALAYARALLFEPVLVEGTATRVATTLTLHFEPPPPPPPPPPPAPEPVAVPAATPAPAPKVVDDGPGMTARVRSRRAAQNVADLHLHVGHLADVPRRNATELLSMAPGVMLTNHGGEGHAPAVFLRGFNAGEGQDIEFRVDGVPINEMSNPHSHGYADAHFVIPELIDELRVVEGPYAPQQADFAVAGSMEYHLGLHERGVLAKATAGTYDQQRMLVAFGPRDLPERTFAAVELKRGTNFGVNRAYSAASAMAQYEAAPAPGTTVDVSGQSYTSRFDSAGVVRLDDVAAGRMPGCATDFDSQFFCTYDPNQGGASQRHSASVRLRQQLGREILEAQAFVARRDLRLREDFTGFVNDVRLDGQDQRGDGVELLYGATTVGLGAAYRLRPRAFDRTHDLELGLEARYDDATTASSRLRFVGGQPYARNFDLAFGVARISGWLGGTLRLTDTLTLRGGARVDSFQYTVTDRNRPAADRQGTRLTSDTTDASGAVAQPRLTLQWKFLDGFEWATSAGTGARSTDVAALSQGESAPFQTVFAAESGVTHQASGGPSEERWNVESRASAFWSYVDRDLLFDEVAARNVLKGASHRYGATASGRFTWGEFLDVSASTTWAEAWSLADGATMFQLEGAAPRPYIPRFVNRLDAALRRPATVLGEPVSWGLAAGASYVAPRPLPLGKWSDPIFTIDASAHVRWRSWILELSATNLLDARYRLAEFNYASNFTSPDFPPSLYAARHASAGAPRMVFVTLSYTFDAGPHEGDDHDVHTEPADDAGGAP